MEKFKTKRLTNFCWRKSRFRIPSKICPFKDIKLFWITLILTYILFARARNTHTHIPF